MALKYKGIREGYPRIEERFGKVAGYIQLVRPFTLLAPLMAGLFGTLAPLRDIGLNHIYTAIYVGLTLAIVQAVGQIINQYADAELDAEIKPYRPIPSGRVSREEALGLAWLLAIFSVGRAFTISIGFGLIILTLLFFAVFYSLSPLSPRRVNPLLNVAWMSFSRGFLPMVATISIYGSLEESLVYAVLAFTWVFGFQSTKDVLDAEGDRKHGIKTVPNTYGEKGLIMLMIVSTVAYTILLTVFNKPIMALNIPVAVGAIMTVKKASKITENVYAWSLFYIGLALIFLLTFIGYKI